VQTGRSEQLKAEPQTRVQVSFLHELSNKLRPPCRPV